VETDQPFTAIEDKSFQKMIKFCNPNAEILSADTIREQIINNFDHARGKIRLKFQVYNFYN
jgi:hypothetical protein